MRLHPLHPAAWVLDQVRETGWHVHDLLAFTRGSTLILVSQAGEPPVVLKAGFGSNHVLAELDQETRASAYGFYWYAQMSEEERARSREDFRHEIAVTRAASASKHVVPLLQHGSTQRFDWYTMPYCEGGNFRPFVSPASDTSTDGLAVLADVAAGLHELHHLGIVHRDVYQENILISGGRGLITDLGAARRIDTPRGPYARGPEVHWPPEYATGYNRATPAADVFSLAVLIYRYLYGDIPRLDGQADLPLALRPLIVAGLAQKPENRPSMSELRDALQHVRTSS